MIMTFEKALTKGLLCCNDCKHYAALESICRKSGNWQQHEEYCGSFEICEFARRFYKNLGFEFTV